MLVNDIGLNTVHVLIEGFLLALDLTVMNDVTTQ